MPKAAFLDLNGTLAQPILVQRLEELQPVPGAGPAIAALNRAGFRCPVITVQSRIVISDTADDMGAACRLGVAGCPLSPSSAGAMTSHPPGTTYVANDLADGVRWAIEHPAA